MQTLYLIGRDWKLLSFFLILSVKNEVNTLHDFDRHSGAVDTGEFVCQSTVANKPCMSSFCFRKDVRAEGIHITLNISVPHQKCDRNMDVFFATFIRFIWISYIFKTFRNMAFHGGLCLSEALHLNSINFSPNYLPDHWLRPVWEQVLKRHFEWIIQQCVFSDIPFCGTSDSKLVFTVISIKTQQLPERATSVTVALEISDPWRWFGSGGAHICVCTLFHADPILTYKDYKVLLYLGLLTWILRSPTIATQPKSMQMTAIAIAIKELKKYFFGL